MNYEFSLLRPEYLITYGIVVLLILWLKRARFRVVLVPSTQIWQELQPSRHQKSRKIGFWLVVAGLAVVVGRPILLPAGEDSSPPEIVVWPSRHAADPTRIELWPDYWEGATDSGSIPEALLVEESPEPTSLQGIAQPNHWLFELPASDRPRSIVVRYLGEERELEVPAAPRPVRVALECESPSTERVLQVLATEGWIERSPDPDVRIVRSATAKPARKTVRLPAPESNPEPFPRVRPSWHPLLDGLESEEWIITNRLESGDLSDAEVILDSDLGPLIERNEREIQLNFDPDREELTQRAAWLVLWGRLLVAAPPESPITARASTWNSLTFVKIFVAILALFLVAPSLRSPRSALLPLGALALLLIPASSLPTRFQRTVENFESWPIRAEEWRQFCRAFAYGGEIAKWRLGPLPLDLARSEARLQALGLETVSPQPRADSSPKELSRIVPKNGFVDQSFEWRPAIEPDRESVKAIDPYGRPKDDPHGSPQIAGTWLYQRRGIKDRAGRSLRRVSSRLVGWVVSSDGGLAQKFRSPEFDLLTSTTFPKDRRVDFVVWDQHDPALWSPQAWLEFEPQIRAGATLFATAGPPFYPDSDGKRKLNQLLPAPLPAEPTEKIEDYGLILLDASGSLRDFGVETVTLALSRLLAESQARGRWGVASFSTEVRSWIEVGTRIDGQAVERVRKIEAGGGTRLDLGIESAYRTLATRSEGRSLFLITDGRTSRAADSIWRDWGRRYREADITVTILKLGSSVTEALTQFSGAAEARWVEVNTAAAASRSLAQALSNKNTFYLELQGEIRRRTHSPGERLLPELLPRPRQPVRLEPSSKATALYADSANQPILLKHRYGEGESYLLSQSFESRAVGPEPVERVYLELVRRLILLSERAKPQATQKLQWRQSEDGTDYLFLRRSEKPAPPWSARWKGANSDARPASAEIYGKYVRFRAPPAQSEFLSKWLLELDGYPHGRHDLKHLAAVVPPSIAYRSWDLFAAILLVFALSSITTIRSRL